MGIIEQMQEDGWPKEAIDAVKIYEEADYDIFLDSKGVHAVLPDGGLETIWEPEEGGIRWEY